MSKIAPAEAETIVELSRILVQGERLAERGIPFPGAQLLAARERKFESGELRRLPELTTLASRLLRYWTKQAKRYVDFGKEYIELEAFAKHHALPLPEGATRVPPLGPVKSTRPVDRAGWAAAITTAARSCGELRSAIFAACLDEGLRLGIQIRELERAGTVVAPRALERLHELVQATRYKDLTRTAAALEELRGFARAQPLENVWIFPRVPEPLLHDPRSAMGPESSRAPPEPAPPVVALLPGSPAAS